MSDQLPIHISIYVKNDEATGEHDKLKIAYEIEDNDECLIFTPVMFREALNSFAKDHEYLIVESIHCNILMQRIRMMCYTMI
jgi:hypothetical protein